jgi:hypothetical protein
MLDGLAQPQSSMPYVQTGLRMALYYIVSLLLRESLDLVQGASSFVLFLGLVGVFGLDVSSPGELGVQVKAQVFG